MSLLFFSEWQSHPRALARLRSGVPRSLEPVGGSLRDVAAEVYRCVASDTSQPYRVAILTAQSGMEGFGQTETSRLYRRDSSSVFALTEDGLPLNMALRVELLREGLTVEVPVRSGFGGVLYLDGEVLETDRIVRAWYDLTLSPVLWTRDEPGRTRVGLVPGENFQTFLPGGFAVRLGDGGLGEEYPLPNLKPSWVRGVLPLHPVAFRAGVRPEVAVPIKVSTDPYDQPDVLVGTDRVQVLRQLPGPLWHWTWSFGVAGTGKVGEALYLAPIPEPDERAVLQVGEGRFFVSLPFEETPPELFPGQVGVSVRTGQVVFEPSDLKSRMGQEVRYLGVALGQVEIRSPQPLRMEGIDLYVPQGGCRVPATPQGVSGWGWVPDGSGLTPTRTGTTVRGAVRTVLEGVAPPKVWFGFDAVEVKQVDKDRDLPVVAPSGTAVFSAESAKIVLDRAVSDPPMFHQAVYQLARTPLGVGRIGSVRRGSFALSVGDALQVWTNRGKVRWVSTQEGVFSPERTRDLLLTSLGGFCEVEVFQGRLILSDLDRTRMEVLPEWEGVTDFSGATKLGFPSGWVSGSSQVWLLDPGVGAAIERSPVPTDTDRVPERILASPISDFPVMSLLVSPWGQDPRLFSGEALRILPFGSNPPIPVRMGRDVLFDPKNQTLTWFEEKVSTETEGPHLPKDGEIQLASQVEVQTPTGGWVRPDPDRVVETPTEWTLTAPFPIPLYRGPMEIRGGFAKGSYPDRIDLAQIETTYYPVWREGEGVRFPPQVEGTFSEVVLFQQGGFALYGTWEPLRLLSDETIRIEVQEGGRSTLLQYGADFSIDLQTGVLGFVSPLPARAALLATYYRATPKGVRVGSAITELVRFVQDKVQAKEEAGYFYFGVRAGQPPVDLSQSVTILEQDPQGVTQPSRYQVQYPPDLPGSGLVRATVPTGTKFLVTYTASVTAGGERTGQLLRVPVYLPWLRVPAGQTEVVFRGDRTDQFGPGRLVRVGSEVFWTQKVSFADDLTKIELTPAADQDAGAPAAGAATVFLIGKPAPEGGFVSVGVRGAQKGAGEVEIDSDLPPTSGSILDLEGCPSWIDSVEGVGGPTYRVRLLQGLRAKAEGATKGKLLRAPFGLVGTEIVPGLPLGEPFPGAIQVVRFESDTGKVSGESRFDPLTQTIQTTPLDPGVKFALVGTIVDPHPKKMRQVGLERSSPPYAGTFVGGYLGSGRDWFTLTMSPVPIPTGYFSPWDSIRQLEQTLLGTRQLLQGGMLVASALAKVVADQKGVRYELDPYWMGPDSLWGCEGCLDAVTGRVTPWRGEPINLLDKEGEEGPTRFVQVGEVDRSISSGWVREKGFPIGKVQGTPTQISILPRGWRVGEDLSLSGDNPSEVFPHDPVWVRVGERWIEAETIDRQKVSWKAPGVVEPSPSQLYAGGFPLGFWAVREETYLTTNPLFDLTESEGVWIEQGRLFGSGHKERCRQIRKGSEVWTRQRREHVFHNVPKTERRTDQIWYPQVLRVDADTIHLTPSSLQWDREGFGFVFGASRGPQQAPQDLWGFRYDSVEDLGSRVVLRVRELKNFADLPLIPQEGMFVSGSGVWRVSRPGEVPKQIRLSCPWPSKPVEGSFNYEPGGIRIDLSVGDWRLLYGYNRSSAVSLYRCLIPGTMVQIVWGEGGGMPLLSPEPDLTRGIEMIPTEDPTQIRMLDITEPYLLGPQEVLRTSQVVEGDWIVRGGRSAQVVGVRADRTLQIKYLGDAEGFFDPPQMGVGRLPGGEGIVERACEFLTSPWGIGVPHRLETLHLLQTYGEWDRARKRQLEAELLGSDEGPPLQTLPEMEVDPILQSLSGQIARWAKLARQIGQRLKGQ